MNMMIKKWFRIGAAIIIGSQMVFNPGRLEAQQVKGDSLYITLENALEIALNDNYQLKIADEEIRRVDYLNKENWYALLPSLNGSAGYTYNLLKPVFYTEFAPGGKMTIGFNNSYSVAGQLDVPIYSAANFLNIRISEIDMQIALESARSTKLDLVKQVKNAFYGALMVKESIMVLQESYNNALETANNIADKYEVGMASEYDMIRADVAARNILPNLTQAESSLQLALMQLKMLLSLDMNTPLDVLGDFESYESDIVNYMPRNDFNFGNNSDLINMDLNLQKMNKSLDLIKAQRLPSVRGSATYSLSMQENTFKFETPWSNAIAMGFTVTVPIFNRMSISMKSHQAQAGIRQMEYQRKLMEDGIAISAQNSVNEMTRAKTQLLSDKEAVKQAQKGYEIAKVMYDTGAGTILDLNTSEVALTNSRITMYQTIYNFLNARNEFEMVLGGEEN